MKFSAALKKMTDSGNQEGFVLVTALLIMVTVTLLGVAASNTALFETIISGGERLAQEQFYKADAGINAELARNILPASGFQVANVNTFTCASAASPDTPFTRFDLDGDNAPDVFLYLLGSPTGSPPEVKVASCAPLGNTIAEIVVGVQYSMPAGGLQGPGDPNQL